MLHTLQPPINPPILPAGPSYNTHAFQVIKNVLQELQVKYYYCIVPLLHSAHFCIRPSPEKTKLT